MICFLYVANLEVCARDGNLATIVCDSGNDLIVKESLR